jgi:hypothetical protein
MTTGRSRAGQSAEGPWRGTVNGKQVTFEKPTGCALWFSTIQGKRGSPGTGLDSHDGVHVADTPKPPDKIRRAALQKTALVGTWRGDYGSAADPRRVRCYAPTSKQLP